MPSGRSGMVRVVSSVGQKEAILAVADRLGVRAMTDTDMAEVATVGDIDVPDGSPQWRIEAAFLRALAPKHILFLCVANSARSQLAEGLARELAPEGVKISSAGSVPTSVRPEAVAALAEVDIDIRHHRSTGMGDVQRPVDAVITLCAEEVCPVWLEDAWRVHWGLPDPAAATGSDEEQLDAFRVVRDELRSRLGVLFDA